MTPTTVGAVDDRSRTAPTVLLTGFEPFDGALTNASWDACRALVAGWDDEAEGAVLRAGVLPVAFGSVGGALASLVAEHRPDVLVCTGLAPGTVRLRVERVALNLADARIPDNDGDQPVDEEVVPGAPAALHATLPVKAVLAAARAADLPVQASLSAGSFVCNAAMFHALAAGTVPRAGFVHVPPRQFLALPETVAALREIVRAVVGHAGADLHVVGGSIA